MSAIFRKINLSKNRDTVIKNNIFIGDVNGDICFDFGDYANKTIPINWELRESGKFNELMEKKLLVNNAVSRTILLNEKIEKIIKYSNLYNYSPVLRIHGCFSSLSSIRQKTEMSDLAQLELGEKANLLNFIKNGFHTKIIVSLDMNMIFSNNAYTQEQYIERCKDLHNTLKYFKEYKNLEVAFDYRSMLDSVYVMDTLLVAQASNIMFDSDLIGYPITIFDSDKYVIETEINKFESRFEQLLKMNQTVQMFSQINEKIDFFDNIYKNKVEHFFNK